MSIAQADDGKRGLRDIQAGIADSTEERLPSVNII